MFSWPWLRPENVCEAEPIIPGSANALLAAKNMEPLTGMNGVMLLLKRKPLLLRGSVCDMSVMPLSIMRSA